MTRYFVDTSALVKRYHQEHGTDFVDAMFADPQAVRLISRLGIVETVSAFAMKVRVGDLSQADFSTARKRFLADIASRSVSAVRLLVSHYQAAERLLQLHATTKRLRTLDALQLAVALDLKKRDEIDEFVSADRVLVELANVEGLTALNPSP